MSSTTVAFVDIKMESLATTNVNSIIGILKITIINYTHLGLDNISSHSLSDIMRSTLTSSERVYPTWKYRWLTACIQTCSKQSKYSEDTDYYRVIEKDGRDLKPL